MASTMDLTLGALEVGTLLSVALYGLITLQVYVYFQGDYHDHVIIRTLVPAIWILDTIHTCFLSIYLYHLTVTNYGKPKAINDVHWSLNAVLLLNGILSFLVQSFFAYRIKVLSGRLAIGIIFWAVCVARLGTNLMLVTLAAITKHFDSYLGQYWWTIPMSSSVQAFGDVLNTSAMCFFLSRRKTGHGRTNRIITRVIYWTIETGLLTTMCAVITIIFCLTMSTSWTWLGLYFFFPKFYSISMLVSLNNREKLRNEVPEKSQEETSVSSIQLSICRLQEVPAVKMGSGRSGGEWGRIGQKPAWSQ